ncbi:MAG: serine/threonine-protein kinase [Planctomycetota bacterium]|nr:MAG: serine/threonine-protein kinase [Planctomycetota bacterium]
MSEVPGDEQRDVGDDEKAARRPENSVIQFLERKTGAAPRVTLREEDSASVAAPVIDPSSQEKFSVPQGRRNYQFMGEIARGGMAVILKGHDSDLGRDVAVKVLDKRLCDRMDVVRRFVEEAQIGGQLQHPGIVPVYDLGLMEDERPYFTMKLVKGRTLAALLDEREGPGSNLGRLIDIFESVCQTMAYAHSRGVIHRDLKPANIMVGAFGEVQVVDWGLAKVLLRGGTADERRAREAHSQMTILETVRSDGSSTGTDSVVGSVLGTPAYMPPEQASGRVDRLNERADVFALGAILCEILTGLPPYHGERDAVISAAAQAELDEAFERLDACQADAALVKVARQCLTAAPAARPANAGVLAERVHDYVVSIEERAHRAEVEAAEAVVRAQEERKARKLTLALGAAVVSIVLVGGGGWLWVQNERATQRQAEAERLRLAVVRDQELSSDVNAALNTAATLQGAQRWDEAVLAAERARALAEGGGASEELLASVSSVLVDVNGAMDEAREREELRLDTQRLLSELREVAQPGEMDEDTQKAEAFRATLLAHGLDLDAGELEAAAESLTRRGLGSEIALALDAWAEARRVDGNETGALRLLELAHLVDPDPERANLREALANRDLDELRYLASSGLEEQPAGTIALLATSLDRLEDREAALSVYRAGAERHPDDFELLYRLARMLTPDADNPGPPDELREAVLCYRAALSLHPDNPWIRFYLGRIHDKLDEPERSLAQYQKAVDMDPDFGRFRFRLAGIQRDLRLLAESRANYEQTVTLDDPNWVRGWSLAGLGRLAFWRGEHGAAAELARQAWNSEASSSWFARGIMLMPLFHITGVTGEEDTMLEARELFEERFSRSAAGHNLLAWRLVESVEGLGSGQVLDGLARAGAELLLALATELAERAVELNSRDSNLWNTLGVARYFVDDFEGAVDALTKEIELGGSAGPMTWFTLAMSHHELGDEDAARRWYAHAMSWMATNASDGDMQWFRAEAGRLLGED